MGRSGEFSVSSKELKIKEIHGLLRDRLKVSNMTCGSFLKHCRILRIEGFLSWVNHQNVVSIWLTSFPNTPCRWPDKHFRLVPKGRQTLFHTNLGRIRLLKAWQLSWSHMVVSKWDRVKCKNPLKGSSQGGSIQFLWYPLIQPAKFLESLPEISSHLTSYNKF